MEHKILKYTKLGDICTIIRGFKLNRYDKPLAEDDGEKVKILTMANLHKLKEPQNIDAIQTSVMKMQNKQGEEERYVKKGDIIFPVFPSENRKNIIYIDEEYDKCIYSETLFVLRVTDESISSKYVYMLLSSDFLYNYILELSKTGKVLKYRLTSKILEEMQIPIYDDETISKLLDESSRIDQLKKQLETLNKEFDNKLNELATYGNGLKIK